MERIINIEDSVIKHSHQDTVSHILVVHQWQVCLRDYEKKSVNKILL